MSKWLGRYRGNWVMSTGERTNSTTARDNASAGQKSMATKPMYAEIESNTTNGFQTIARCEAEAVDKTTEGQHQMAGSLHVGRHRPIKHND